MAEPRYALIAIDLDGTAMGEDLIVPPANRLAVLSAQAAGAVVVVATGRTRSMAAPHIKALGAHGPTITHQGAVTTLEGVQIRHLRVAPALATEALTLAEANGDVLYAHFDEESLAAPHHARSAYYEELNGVSARTAPDLRARLAGGVTKLVIVSDHAAPVTARYAAAFAGRLQVTQSNDRLTELTHVRATKGDALTELAARLGIPLSACVAFGDQPNDASMILAAGLGVAMANAHPDVLAVADQVAPSAAAAGVATVLATLLLGPAEPVVIH